MIYQNVFKPNQESLAKDLIKIYPDFPIEGVKYLDLNPVYLNSDARTQLTMHCIQALEDLPDFDYIAAIESRGFLVGSLIAHIMNKGILLVRSKPGRLPGDKVTIKHTLEYGDGQMEVQKAQQDAVLKKELRTVPKKDFKGCVPSPGF